MRCWSEIAGTTHAVSGVVSDTATGKPKYGTEPGGAQSSQLAPPSRLRKMPQWFCCHSPSGSLRLAATKCGSWPTTADGEGRKSQRTPAF